MKYQLITIFMLLFFNFSVFGGIFGDNDITDIEDAPTHIKEISSAVGMLVERRLLLPNLRKNLGTNQKILKTWSHFNGRQTLAEQYLLDSHEKFSNQASLGFCSLFLVSSSKALTATHCTRESNFKQNSLVVFDYYSHQYQPRLIFKFSSHNVFKINKVEKLTHGDDGVSLITLDRPAQNRKTLTLSPNKLEEGRDIYTIHHPLGLPLKYSSNGRIDSFKWMKKVNGEVFKHDLDAMSGSSGAPIISSSTNSVIGIVLGGSSKSLKRKGLFSSTRVFRRHKKLNWLRYSVGIELPSSMTLKLD